MIQHSGNQANQIQFEEHDGELNAKRVTLIGAAGQATVALVGNVTVEQGDVPWNSLGTVTMNGVVTTAPSPNYIGLTTTTLGLGDRFIGLVTVVNAGNVTLNASAAFIGIVTVANTVNANVSLGASAQFIGIVTVANTINANVSLSAGVAFIGHATVRIATNVNTNIGLVTVDGGRIGLTGNNTIVLGSGIGGIGFATVAIQANVNTNIGLVTVDGGRIGLLGNNTVVLGSGVGNIGFATVNIAANPNTFIGLTTSVNGAGDRFIGLVTAVTRNAGTNKTLKILPIRLSTNSNSSIAISNTFYITSILLNSNATVRLNILSGVTYLTGNVSLGINIFPGGGWVETGSVDAPIYIGQAGAAPINFEKADAGGIISQVAGKVVYFDE